MRTNNIEQSIVNNFIQKLQSRDYLINSKAVSIFSDNTLNTSEKLEQAFIKFLKGWELAYLNGP